jgi:small-conductance mechanosensitive channel/CRP-like cAMP-binding protein
VTIWSATLTEAEYDRTLYLVSMLVATAGMLRAWAHEEHRRLRLAVGLVFVHLVLLPVVGVMRARGVEFFHDGRLALMMVTGLGFVGIGGMLLFAALLPRVGLRVPRILRDVITAVAGVITIFATASRAGFNLSSLIATSAVMTAVIGFSLADTLGNIMGGLALQMDNSIKVGDWIKAGDVNGRVSEIRWRYTAVENRNWETVIIPNSMLMKGQVTVVGRRQGKPEQWRRWVWFNVDFRYQPSDVIQAVEEALRMAPIERVATDPPPNCILMDLFDSYGKYAVRYWLTDLPVDDPTDSVIRTRIYFALKRANMGLSIPSQNMFMTQRNAELVAAEKRDDDDQRMRVLRGVEIFEALSEPELRELSPGLRYAPFTKNEVMTHQGAEAHWLYMMIDGEAAVRVEKDGAEKEVARLHAHDFFGEMSLLTGAKRSATVVALGDVECYRLDQAVFKNFITARPEYAKKFAEVLARRKVGLEAARDGLDEETKHRRVKAEEIHLLEKIVDFFGLGDEHAAVG